MICAKFPTRDLFKMFENRLNSEQSSHASTKNGIFLEFRYHLTPFDTRVTIFTELTGMNPFPPKCLKIYSIEISQYFKDEYNLSNFPLQAPHILLNLNKHMKNGKYAKSFELNEKAAQLN